MQKLDINFHGRTFSIETGRIAKQAGGAVLVRYADSIVLVTACMGEDKGGDFLPLTIDYIEKTYAAGKIPGGFFKREGKLSEKEILTSRLIDRPCRPLFPEGFGKEVQVLATVLSADDENDTDILSMIGASAALTLSEIPFEGPIAAVRVSKVKDKFIINPTKGDRESAELDLVVAGTRDAIVMVEGGAAEVAESVICEALLFAHREMQSLIDLQSELQKKSGKAKVEFKREERYPEIKSEAEKFLRPELEKACQVAEKLARRSALSELKERLKQKFIKEGEETTEEVAAKQAFLDKVFDDQMYNVVREKVFKTDTRIDGRDLTTVRPISIELGFLPRTHGSALFTRGETQAIVVTTLGTESEAQKLDPLFGETSKRFMLHYNFPPFSVGETKPLRGPGRREIGHGALAERAVKAVLPNEKDFPYVIRIVSEVTESNGSSSMATVCGSSLSLMDAGVPIKAAVAGVAMGLMVDGEKTAILTDILGDEDHLGDMDFKVCGTAKGITALQMDIKIKGLKESILTAALDQAKKARLFILDQMNNVIQSARADVSQYAPRITTIKVKPDQVRDVIGSGGKTIRWITETYGVKVDVSDDGNINIAGSDQAQVKAAINYIESITQEPEVGKIYEGIVKKIVEFGAFVEILPGIEGLLHISELAEGRVKRVQDVLSEADRVFVKVLEIEPTGKLRLSRRAALTELSSKTG
ncbi:MAG TPA: polyribonucleotide nucleotidyltransferase [Oligoflexia bacterium]|nr:polyribonucleotide nucleotidyltransferase [Oligoflexia bacterium]HMP26461.1 polyribonucleotide nucleotidyltransferase [Oligoflexia bacterium]